MKHVQRIYWTAAVVGVFYRLRHQSLLKTISWKFYSMGSSARRANGITPL
jgi:hypothetical protein